MNTNYVSKLNPQFDNAGVSDVSADLSVAKAGMDIIVKQNENELKTLRNIAQDQAQIEYNRGAAELTKKFGTDYEGLNKALLNLEQGLYNKIKPVYPEIAEDLLRQHDIARGRAVDHARNTYIKEKNKKIRNSSGLLLDGLEAAAANDWLIYIGEISTKDQDKRRPEMLAPFLSDLEQHNAILSRRDMDGNPIFTDTQVSSRKGMKGVRMQGTLGYMYGLELDDLQKWYGETLRSEQFMKDTGFNYDDIQKIATKTKSRIKELKDDKDHIIKVRAVQDTVNLINNGNDLTTINRLKENGVVPKELIDQTVEASNNNIEENWYDPNKTEDPFGMLKLYSKLDTLVSNKDYSPESSEEKLKTFVELMTAIDQHKKELNLDDDTYREYQNDIKKAILDESFGKKLQDVVNYSKEAGVGDFLVKTASKTGAYPVTKSASRDKTQAELQAQIYANQKLPEILTALRWENDDVFQRLMKETRYNVVKLKNSHWISPSEFDRLEQEFQEGKEPILIHDGVPMKYNGVRSNKAIFEVKI